MKHFMKYVDVVKTQKKETLNGKEIYYYVISVAVTPDYLKDLPEAVTMFGCFAYGLLHGTVILDRLVVEVRSVDVHHLARPRDAHSIFFYDSVRNVLFDLGL